MNYLQPELVERVIKSTRGTVFSVTLDDGSTINARLMGYLSGITTIFDMKSREFRDLNLNKIISLKANRKTYKVEIPL